MLYIHSNKPIKCFKLNIPFENYHASWFLEDRIKQEQLWGQFQKTLRHSFLLTHESIKICG